MIAYGMGAKTLPGEGNPTCQLFSITGDYSDPFIENEDQMLSCYAETIKAVEITLPIYYKPIVKFVCDLAQMEIGTASDATQIKNYYVLTLLMAVIIDDIEDSINEILRAAELPISVIIIKVGDGANADNDSLKLFDNSKQIFDRCERVFIEMIDFSQYKSKPGANKFEESKGQDQVQFYRKHFQFDMVKSIPF